MCLLGIHFGLNNFLFRNNFSLSTFILTYKIKINKMYTTHYSHYLEVH